MSNNKLNEELQKQVKQIKKLLREDELTSGTHRYNAAGPMKDKKKEQDKYASRKSRFDDER